MGFFTNWLESLSYEIQIGKQCLRETSPFSTCDRCVQACPENAIDLTKKEAKIDEKTCTACGKCITVCPVQAIKGRSPSRKVVGKTLILDHAPLPTKNELLYFHQKGIQNLEVKMPEKQVELLKVIDETNNLLKELGCELFSIGEKKEEVSEEKPVYSRRDFFNKISYDSKKTVLSTVTPSNWRFNEENFKLSALFPDLSFFQISFNEEDCSLCEACFHVCPSAVFVIKEKRLTIDENRCSGCQLCRDVCQNKAIFIQEKPQQRKPKEYQLYKIDCTTCGSSFLSWKETNKCFVCNQKKHSSILSFL